jgi:hydroxyacylglutathione hydrolase
MTSITPISAFQDNYIWVIIHSDNKTITCIDPGLAEPLSKAMQQNGWVLQNILITHHHHDHIGGIETLLKHAPNCNVYAPNDSRISAVTHRVHDGEKIIIDSYIFSILAIPGHTCSHIAYYEAEQYWLFCGDTLFSAGCGRVFDGTIEQLYATLQKIKQLPDETKIYCGHEYTKKNLTFALTIEPENRDIKQYLQSIQNTSCTLPSTLTQEKKVNPFLRTHLPALQTFANSRNLNPSDQMQVFKQLRHEKDHW